MVNHIFRSIFYSPELRKYMIGGRNPSVGKQSFFMGFINLLIVKLVTLNKRL